MSQKIYKLLLRTEFLTIIFLYLHAYTTKYLLDIFEITVNKCRSIRSDVLFPLTFFCVKFKPLAIQDLIEGVRDISWEFCRHRYQSRVQQVKQAFNQQDCRIYLLNTPNCLLEPQNVKGPIYLQICWCTPFLCD